MKIFQSGQTLLEVMIALFILVTGFLGILTLLSQSLALSKTLDNETTATYLAEEGIEIMRNFVDHDIYSGQWIQGAVDNCLYQDSDYDTNFATKVDLTTGVGSSVACPSLPEYNAGDYLEYNPTTHEYLYAADDVIGGGAPTIFTREIKIKLDADSNPNEIDVQSIVTWSTGTFTTQSVVLEDVFYNWIPS